ncbi:MAG: hypothetical protein PHC62_00110 [Candidatus Izemoplasmatales bacterium]|nr:hypothetical protein [Candidatus Izemoplasmatales bacterium]
MNGGIFMRDPKMKTYRYFIFSNTQKKEREEIEKEIGRVFKPGIVAYKGVKRQFTELLTDISKCRYADFELVAEGYLQDITYSLPTHEKG